MKKERDTSDWILNFSCEEADGEGNSFIVASLRLLMMMINNRWVFYLGTRVRRPRLTAHDQRRVFVFCICVNECMYI